MEGTDQDHKATWMEGLGVICALPSPSTLSLHLVPLCLPLRWNESPCRLQGSRASTKRSACLLT